MSVTIRQASRDLDVGETLLRRWIRELSAGPKQAFPGQGVMKPDQAEIERLRKEVAKLKMERDILKKLRQGVNVKFSFVAKHRGVWPVDLISEALGVSRSRFYAWLSRPRNQHNIVDEILLPLVCQSFAGSDRTYSARRVWHDVLALGQRCGLHRIERLMRQQALRARPHRRGLLRDRGECSTIADDVLDRQFEAEAPIRNGWLISLTSGRPKVGCMSQWCWTCTPDGPWVGSCRKP